MPRTTDASTAAFDEEFARRFAERLASEPPARDLERPRTLSRRALVANSYEVLLAKRREGYSYEVLAHHCTQLGMPIRVSTLRTYMQRQSKIVTAPGIRKTNKRPTTRVARSPAARAVTPSSPPSQRVEAAGSGDEKHAAAGTDPPSTAARHTETPQLIATDGVEAQSARAQAQAPTPRVLPEHSVTGAAEHTNPAPQQRHETEGIARVALASEMATAPTRGSEAPGELAATSSPPSAPAQRPENSAATTLTPKTYRSAIAIRPEKPLSAFKDRTK